MPRWLADLLGNAAFTALAGAIIGAAASYLVGVRLAYNQRRRTHRAAVRAVFYELGELLTLAEHPQPHRRPSTAAYDALSLPLYTDIPESTGADLAYAYALVHMLGSDPAALPQLIPELTTARAALRNYARDNLGLTFPEPGPKAAG